jgi:hypothetical protein
VLRTNGCHRLVGKRQCATKECLVMIYHHRCAPALPGSQGRFINHHEADSARQDVPEARRRLIAGNAVSVSDCGRGRTSCDVTEYQVYSFSGARTLQFGTREQRKKLTASVFGVGMWSSCLARTCCAAVTGLLHCALHHVSVPVVPTGRTAVNGKVEATGGTVLDYRYEWGKHLFLPLFYPARTLISLPTSRRFPSHPAIYHSIVIAGPVSQH